MHYSDTGMNKSYKQTRKTLISILIAIALAWQLVWLYVFAWTQFDATYGILIVLAILAIGSLGIAVAIVNFKQRQSTISSQASIVILAAMILGGSYFIYTLLAVLNGLLD